VILGKEKIFTTPRPGCQSIRNNLIIAEDNKHFLTSLPGILTGIAAVITAVATLLVTLNNKPDLPPVNPDPSADSTPPTSQPAEPSQSTVRPAIPPLRIAGDRLTIQPQLPQTLHAFNLPAVIEDPDGFTYVRSMKSSASQIVAKINKNERFCTFHQSENWWQVKTAQGKVGDVHVSRIKLLANP